MKKKFIENGFIINLSTAKNTNQLIYELSNILEHPDVKGKRVFLKLGNIDLKQSQLLSIKALIEAADAEIAFIETVSEQTEASASSLEIETKSADEMEADMNEPLPEKEELITEEISNEEDFSSNATEEIAEEPSEEITEEILSDEENTEKVIEVSPEFEQEPTDNNGIINTLTGIEDTYTETSEEKLSQIIESDDTINDFETFAMNEGLLQNENESKYIILETGDVVQKDAQEYSSDTNNLPTLYLNQTLRSGQTVTYDGNILIIGDAHPGSEIVAEGDITVWGILGGIAHSGYKGNLTTKVRALKLNAIQLRIAGLYARRNDTLNVPYVQKSNNFTPEEAQIENGKIVIYKKLRRD